MSGTPKNPSSASWVFKVGGSLLNMRDLADRLREVIRRTSTRPFLVVGGGFAADLVRQWEACHPLNSEQAHWLAIRAMGLGECLIESLLPEAIGVIRPDEAEPIWKQGGIALVKAFDWLKCEGELVDALPHTWDVTSDSIAAYAAIRFRSSGLMLLKSVTPPSLTDWEEPFVDAYFHQLAPKLGQISWCNLAANPITIKTPSRES